MERPGIPPKPTGMMQACPTLANMRQGSPFTLVKAPVGNILVRMGTRAQTDEIDMYSASAGSTHRGSCSMVTTIS
jgi:hypothetical protein